MAYKIVWARGGETAERYSSKALAMAVVKQSRLSGKVVSVKLGNPGRTSPFSRMSSSGMTKQYPTGVKLRWMKISSRVKGISGFVYRTHASRV